MRILVVCTTDSMIWNFLIPHIKYWQDKGDTVEIACSRTGFYIDELRSKHGFTVHEIPFQRFPFKPKSVKTDTTLSFPRNLSAVCSDEWPERSISARISIRHMDSISLRGRPA